MIVDQLTKMRSLRMEYARRQSPSLPASLRHLTPAGRSRSSVIQPVPAFFAARASSPPTWFPDRNEMLPKPVAALLPWQDRRPPMCRWRLARSRGEALTGVHGFTGRQDPVTQRLPTWRAPDLPSWSHSSFFTKRPGLLAASEGRSKAGMARQTSSRSSRSAFIIMISEVRRGQRSRHASLATPRNAARSQLR